MERAWIVAAIAAAGCVKTADLPTAPIGTITTDLDASKDAVRSRETLAADLITDAIHRGIPEAQIALMNGGNVRFDPSTRPTGVYPAGEWSETTIAELLPFDFDTGGSQMLVTITGAQLKSVLERSVASLQDVSPDPSALEQLKGWFLTGWNLRYTADLSRQAQVLDATLTKIEIEGDRITSIEVGGVPVDPNASYRVSGNEFIMAGEDGHVGLALGTDRVVLERTSADMLADDLMSSSPITPSLDGRVTITKSQ